MSTENGDLIVCTNCGWRGSGQWMQCPECEETDFARLPKSIADKVDQKTSARLRGEETFMSGKFKDSELLDNVLVWAQAAASEGNNPSRTALAGLRLAVGRWDHQAKVDPVSLIDELANLAEQECDLYVETNGAHSCGTVSTSRFVSGQCSPCSARSVIAKAQEVRRQEFRLQGKTLAERARALLERESHRPLDERFQELVDAGLIDSDGTLRPEYGGPRKDNS